MEMEHILGLILTELRKIRRLLETTKVTEQSPGVITVQPPHPIQEEEAEEILNRIMEQLDCSKKSL